MRQVSEVPPVDDMSEEYTEASRSCWTARDGRPGLEGRADSGVNCARFGAKVPTPAPKGVIRSGRACAEPTTTADSCASAAAYDDHALLTLSASDHRAGG